MRMTWTRRPAGVDGTWWARRGAHLPALPPEEVLLGRHARPLCRARAALRLRARLPQPQEECDVFILKFPDVLRTLNACPPCVGFKGLAP